MARIGPANIDPCRSGGGDRDRSPGYEATESGSAQGGRSGRRHDRPHRYRGHGCGRDFWRSSESAVLVISGAFKRLGENMVDDHGDLADGLSNDSARHWKREFEWPNYDWSFRGAVGPSGIGSIFSVFGTRQCQPWCAQFVAHTIAGRRTFTVLIDRRGDGAPALRKSHAGRTGARGRLFGYLV